MFSFICRSKSSRLALSFGLCLRSLSTTNANYGSIVAIFSISVAVFYSPSYRSLSFKFPSSFWHRPRTTYKITHPREYASVFFASYFACDSCDSFNYFNSGAKYIGVPLIVLVLFAIFVLIVFTPWSIRIASPKSLKYVITVLSFLSKLIRIFAALISL